MRREYLHQCEYFGFGKRRALAGLGREGEPGIYQRGNIDFVCAHPPYANIIKYSKETAGDLSHLEVDEFLKEMAPVAMESFRVLKSGRYCAVLIGDTRKNKRVVPLGFMLMRVYLRAGFILKEIIIKEQHNCQATDEWREKSLKYNFLLLAHEYLPVFEKV